MASPLSFVILLFFCSISSSSAILSNHQHPLQSIEEILTREHKFNIVLMLLSSSKVLTLLEKYHIGAGITLLVPSDHAFAESEFSARFKSLPANLKTTVLKFHVLNAYYSLASLESIVNPVQATLATENEGAGTFTLDISSVNGSVSIDTGVVQASVTGVLIDQNPLAIFSVSDVLIPKEMFNASSATIGC